MPQASRRVLPPLLNDFVSLQKDTALVVGVGLFEALGTASDTANYTFNFTPFVVAAALFIALTIPLARYTDHVGRRSWRASGRGPDDAVPICWRSRASARRTATRWCSTASTSPSARHEVVCLIGASGTGKSTLLRCVNLLEHVDDGTCGSRGATSPTPGSTGARSGGGSAWSSSPTTCSRT